MDAWVLAWVHDYIVNILFNRNHGNGWRTEILEVMSVNIFLAMRVWIYEFVFEENTSQE